MIAGLAFRGGEQKVVLIDATCLKAHRTASRLRAKKRGPDDRRGRLIGRTWGGLNAKLHPSRIRMADRRPGLRCRMVAGSVERHRPRFLRPGQEVPRQVGPRRQAQMQAPQPDRDQVRQTEGLAPRRHPARDRCLKVILSAPAVQSRRLGRKQCGRAAIGPPLPQPRHRGVRKRSGPERTPVRRKRRSARCVTEPSSRLAQNAGTSAQGQGRDIRRLARGPGLGVPDRQQRIADVAQEMQVARCVPGVRACAHRSGPSPRAPLPANTEHAGALPSATRHWPIRPTPGLISARPRRRTPASRNVQVVLQDHPASAPRDFRWRARLPI